MVVARTVTHAMAQQVDRVNARHAADLPAKIDDLEFRLERSEVARQGLQISRDQLVTENERLHKRIEQLKNMISTEHRAMLDDSGVSHILVEGRPVLTSEQAAKQVGVSVATVSRYISTGYWHATQQPGSNRWFIFADEPLTKKRSK